MPHTALWLGAGGCRRAQPSDRGRGPRLPLDQVFSVSEQRSNTTRIASGSTLVIDLAGVDSASLAGTSRCLFSATNIEGKIAYPSYNRSAFPLCSLLRQAGSFSSVEIVSDSNCLSATLSPEPTTVGTATVFALHFSSSTCSAALPTHCSLRFSLFSLASIAGLTTL